MSGGSVDHWLHTPKVIWGAGGVDILFSPLLPDHWYPWLCYNTSSVSEKERGCLITDCKLLSCEPKQTFSYDKLIISGVLL